MLSVIANIIDHHNLPLLGLAAVIDIIASFAAVSLVTRASAASTRPHIRKLWIVLGGFAYGGGIWATHFVAMLAFQRGMPVAYALGPTLFSALAGMVGSTLGFVLLSSNRARRARVLLGGFTLGLSISAMHYIGMSGMRMLDSMVHSFTAVVLSIAVGTVFCALAGQTLGNSSGRLPPRLISAALLAVAVLLMHFTDVGMMQVIDCTTPAGQGAYDTALSGGMQIGLGLSGHEPVLDQILLATAVGGISILILILGLAGAFFDQHLSTRAQREMERLRKWSDSTLEGIFIHRRGVVLDANEALGRLLDTRPEDLVGRSMTDFTVPDLSASAGMQLVNLGIRTGEVKIDRMGMLRSDGSQLPVELLARDIEYEGQPARLVSVRDLSEQMKAEARIQFMTRHDELTGLPNRKLFDERLIQTLKEARLSLERVAIIYLDIDSFQTLNSVYGNASGDRLLSEIGAKVQRFVGLRDTAARLGGDEFAIVMRSASKDKVLDLVHSIQEVLAHRIKLGEQPVPVRSSMGIALFPDNASEGDILLRHAETALERAKRNGRSGVVFYERELDSLQHHRQVMAHELAEALERNELQLFFQPLFACQGVKLMGFEALARWDHPTRGPISPSEFVAVAEENGLIVQLGRWALDAACAEASTWEKPLFVAVNLSPAQLHSRIVADVTETLAKYNMPASRLEIEVTESVLITDTETALERLTALKQLGVSLALDDFGTGYSSLSYLRRFPFDRLKIDRSFIIDSCTTPDARTIASAIVALGHSLNIDVTAEGVENACQLEFLREQGCDIVQGYLLAQPMPGAMLAGMVTADYEPKYAEAAPGECKRPGSIVPAENILSEEDMNELLNEVQAAVEAIESLAQTEEEEVIAEPQHHADLISEAEVEFIEPHRLPASSRARAPRSGAVA